MGILEAKVARLEESDGFFSLLDVDFLDDSSLELGHHVQQAMKQIKHHIPGNDVTSNSMSNEQDENDFRSQIDLLRSSVEKRTDTRQHRLVSLKVKLAARLIVTISLLLGFGHHVQGDVDATTVATHARNRVASSQ